MKFKDELLLERNLQLDRLFPAQRDRLKADPELTALAEETAALGSVCAAFPAAPPWENLRAQVIAQAMAPKESAMRNLFNMRRWYVRLALAIVALAVVSGAFMLLPSGPRAWASTNGYVLTFDLPVADYVEGQDCQCTDWNECDHKYLGDFGRVVQAWAAERGEEVGMPPHHDIPGARLKQFLQTKYIKPDPGEGGSETYSMEVTLAGFTAEELQSLLEAVRANPVLPDPAVTDATWYHVGEMRGDIAYSFTIGGELFCFPEYATAEEMEQELNSWIERTYGTEGRIEITIEHSITGGKTITVDLNDCVPQ
jgi:hypothetical protein